MAVTLTLTDNEARKLANLASSALAGDGHRPAPCPICDLASLVQAALERAGIEAVA